MAMNTTHTLTESQLTLLKRIFGLQTIALKCETDAQQLLSERLQLLDHAHAVAEDLIAQGFAVLALRIGTHATITVKATQHTRQLNSVVKGRSHDGAQPYVEFAAVYNGVGIEWKKPMTLALLGIRQRRH
jgi:hypothetical protein